MRVWDSVFFFTKKRIGRERNNAVYKFRDIASFTWRLRRSAYHFYDHRVYMYGILKVHFCQRRWNRHAERSSSFCRFFFNSFRILLYNTTNKHRTWNCQPITLVSKRWKNSIEYTERRVVIIGWNAEMFGLRRKLIRKHVALQDLRICVRGLWGWLWPYRDILNVCRIYTLRRGQ